MLIPEAYMISDLVLSRILDSFGLAARLTKLEQQFYEE